METEMLSDLRTHIQNTPVEQLQEEWKLVIENKTNSPNAIEYLNFINGNKDGKLE